MKQYVLLARSQFLYILGSYSIMHDTIQYKLATVSLHNDTFISQTKQIHLNIL